MGHNLGHRVFTMSVPFRKFYDISAVANDRDAGPVAQRALDPNHAKKLAVYMLKGLVSAAMLRRTALGKDIPPAFEEILRSLGEQPYFSLQPLVCNIRGIPLGGTGVEGIRGMRLETATGETAAFKVFLAERHTLWVVDGQHRRAGAELTMSFLEHVRSIGRYPAKGAVLFVDKGKEISEANMMVWNEAYDAARSYATLTVEVHLGLHIEQERQLFHDLNRLTKKVDPSLALQFDSSNPISQFIKRSLVSELQIDITDQEVKDWSDDKGSLVLKEIVAVNAIAFLNKGNISGATPVVTEPREPIVLRLWERITEIPGFGTTGAKEKTVAAQPVVLKALAKLTYDLNFSNRKPENGEALFDQLLDKLPSIDFSHKNPVWQYYSMSQSERDTAGLAGLAAFLPSDDVNANRDIGAMQNGFMRFGAKHNDIYPIIADMIRWQVGLPSRRDELEVALADLL
ncbi:MAG: hypothetical protein JO256_10895 [Alphaproteobacteria bacterium]|nr:hypothetical protein [Alphaproteobacteria bacterium]